MKETLRGCRRVCRNGRVVVEIDSARRTCVQPPNASVPSRSRGLCGAWPTADECHACATRFGSPRHRNRGRRRRNRADTAVFHVRLEAAESRRPARVLLVNRCGSRQSASPRTAYRARHKSDVACCVAWRDQWDWDPFAGRQTRRGRNNCRRSRGTNRSSRRARANPAVRNESDPKCPRAASRAHGARTSCPSQNRVLAVTSVTECRCAARRRRP